MKKKALLIGNSKYYDSEINALLAPRSDIEKLVKLLESDIAGFDEVIAKFDVSLPDAQTFIHDLYKDADEEDLLFLYYAGHGVRDISGKLYLALRHTKIAYISAQALASSYILEQLSLSRSKKKIVVLDCCHAGAIFEDGTMRARDFVYDPGLLRSGFMPAGSGTYILAASQASQSAFEKHDTETGETYSIYTRLFIDGIKSGEAARGKKIIRVSDIHEYIRQNRITNDVITDPLRSVYEQGDELEFCLNPVPPINDDLLNDLQSDNVRTRRGAIQDLSNDLQSDDYRMARVAADVLQSRFQGGGEYGRERDVDLSALIGEKLGEYKAKALLDKQTRERIKASTEAQTRRNPTKTTDLYNKFNTFRKYVINPISNRIPSGGYSKYLTILVVLTYSYPVFSNYIHHSNSGVIDWSPQAIFKLMTVQDLPLLQPVSVFELVKDLDAPSMRQRADAAIRIDEIFKKSYHNYDDRNPIASLLIDMAQKGMVEKLSAKGRYALLVVLSRINEGNCKPCDWVKLRARMRQAYPLFAEIVWGDRGANPFKAREYLDTLANNMKLNPAATHSIDFQFAGMPRRIAEEISGNMKKIGWKITGEERTVAAGRKNEVRYGQAVNKDIAELLLADLKLLGLTKMCCTAKNSKISQNKLEIWVSK